MDFAMNSPTERQLWQPDRHEQLAACEILLASQLPQDARIVIRDLEQKFRTERTTQ
ncbi:hypothetical protein NKH72_24250 [Mesorhizobium sp. M0955]|uniref:hypothetical protein n=1 Tax=Mesorhizobium sp. M0955 TaxID=2957033 RepID=UPI00333CC1C9